MIQYRKGYKYHLAENACCHTRIRPIDESCRTDWLTLNQSGLLLIGKGYAWNGANGPTFDTTSSMRGSLQHDAKHQLIRLGLVDREYLPVVDQEFRATLLEDGMWRLRVFLWMWGLRRFGSEARPSGEKPIHVAP